MRILLTSWAAALALAAPLAAAAQDGQPGLGEPLEGFEHLTAGEPRSTPGEAVRRDKFDETVADMFRLADTDRDDMVTLAELRAAIDARKAAAIRTRFAAIDANRDQSVSLAEFDAWQRDLGSAVLSEEQAAAASTVRVAEAIGPDTGRGRGALVLARLVEPLSPTMLTAANADYDAGASLAEVVAYEGRRFEAADANNDGWVTEGEVRQAAPRP